MKEHIIETERREAAKRLGVRYIKLTKLELMDAINKRPAKAGAGWPFPQKPGWSNN